MQAKVMPFTVNPYDLLLDKTGLDEDAMAVAPVSAAEAAHHADQIPIAPAAKLRLMNRVSTTDDDFALMAPQRSGLARRRLHAVWRDAAHRIEFDDADARQAGGVADVADFAAHVVLLALPAPDQLEKNKRAAWDAEVLDVPVASADDDGRAVNKAAPAGHRLQLHTADVPRFAGIYAGAVIECWAPFSPEILKVSS